MLPPQAEEHLRPWYTHDQLARYRYTSRSPIAWVFRHVFKQGAVTWNGVVNYALASYDPDTPAGLGLIAHEMHHMLHQERIGWWKYLAQYTWLLRFSRYRGSNNGNHPFEAPAYALHHEVETALREPAPL